MTEFNHHDLPKPGGLRRVWNAAIYSMQGLRAAWTYESSFRQEVTLLILLVPLSFWLADNIYEWLALICSALLVLVTELLNSSIEAAVDRFGRERNELVGRAKDLGSAAVFVSMLIFGLIWGTLLICNVLVPFITN